MTSARLRLVDEAKGKTNGAAPASEVTVKRRAVRGPRAQSEVVARSGSTQAAPKARTGKRASTVADVMRSPAVCCRLADSLQHAAQLMWEKDVGAVVVLDEQGRARHMVTDRDVCMGAYTQGVPLWASRVSSLNPAELVSCPADAGVAEARRLMQEHGVRRIPVLDGAGNVVGVVGLGDLIREATVAAPKLRTRGLTPAQLAQTLTAIYEDVPVPEGRALRS